MKNYKKLIAGTMAAVMVFGSSIVASAADQSDSTTGQGSLDIVKESDIFDVVLPVLPEEGSPFDYILDPTGVIEATDHAKYGDANFESGQTLFFAVSGGDYNHVSDTLTATNKSTMDVEITVKASVAEATGITMAEDTNFVSSGDATAQLYLGLFDDTDNTTGLAITVEGVEATATIAGADDEYEVKYVSDGDYYVKALKDDASNFDTYAFHLEGACSVDGWDGLEENPPAVEVVWTIKDPSGPATSYAKDIVLGGPGEMATADVVIVDDAQLISVTTDVLEGNLLTTKGTWAAFYNTETHTLYFYTGLSDYLRTNPSVTFTLTFKPADGENYTVTLKCAN